MFERALLKLLVALSLSAGPLASAVTPTVIQPSRVSFCETPAPFVVERCTLVPVGLPHNWKPATTGLSFGLYRIEMPRPAPGTYALLLDRLALDGAVRVDGTTVFDELAPDQVRRLRYWPVLSPFQVISTTPENVVIEIAVRGHDELKNGLGGVSIGPLATIEPLYRHRLQRDVLLVAALAFAAISAGIIGLAIGDRRTLTSRILVVTSWLAIVGGARCLHNLIVEPPVSIVIWQRIGLWLLALVSLLAIQIAVTYLTSERLSRNTLWAGLATLTAVFSIPSSLIHPDQLANTVFPALALISVVMVARLAWRLKAAPDRLGLAIVVIYSVALSTGVHDLYVHLSDATLSDQYLQTWTLPAVLVLAVVALAKRAADQREVERALAEATRRREELLRDLHDRVGSRLVALAFHAQQVTNDPALVEEIKSLIHEVRMIHGTVSTEPTSLEALLADLRHLYARVGGGKLPLQWNIAELPSPLRLTAEQAIAVVRITEEAIANIIKHAEARQITIRLSRRDDDDGAMLDIVDDGIGEFHPNGTGGLENMRIRAEQTGLRLEFLRLEEGKAVRIRFPRISPSR